jgi:gas vesicle protein
MSKVFKKVAIATGVAALIGYLAGILTAPKSGKETREDIKKTAQKGLSEAEKQLKRALSELSDLIEEMKKRGSDLGDRASKELHELIAKGKSARDKAREALSATHEGDADDKDIKAVVSQVDDALKQLRAFMKK